MFLAFKTIGATVVAGCLAASGVVTGDRLIGDRDKDGAPVAVEAEVSTTTTTEPATTTTTEPPTTTTTEAPTTTTTEPAPVPPPVTLPPPVQPTVIPVAGAGSVVVVLQGPVIVIQKIKLVPGWVADVERDSGDVNVVFRNGGRAFRFLASLKDRRLTSDIREFRADGERRLGFDDRHDGRDGHRDDGRRTDDDRHDGDGDRDRDGRGSRH